MVTSIYATIKLSQDRQIMVCKDFFIAMKGPEAQGGTSNKVRLTRARRTLACES